ncbi:MAG TPA: hypothetical protein VNK52_05600 [Hyphomicrobiaceae bacterium]|nr:hypothetical protein [Hyphomicrobiaceae bacterium]
MSKALQAEAGGLTSSLNPAQNDTGRVAFCGPYVISAITGWTISKVEDEIRRYREIPEHRKPVVRGTYADEVEGALAAFGYRMTLKRSYMHLPRKQRPTVWSWMQQPRSAWAHYILAIHKGKEGHWILIRGAKMCDTYTEGRWTFVCDGPHRGARIMEVFEVRRALEP